MDTAAIVIGINDYAHQPLTSAVNDARALRDALLKHSLVRKEEIIYLTSPREEDSEPASWANIRNALYSFYNGTRRADRLLFFFSGHGMLAFSNASRTRPITVLVTPEVTDFRRDGNFLIDFDEVLETMRMNGPAEQFYFIDACRDLAYEAHPNVGVLGIAGNEPDQARNQAAIFAVSPLGRAAGVKEGLGVMTSHILNGLEGKGEALEYDEEADQYVVTIQSLYNHVRGAVERGLAGQPLWQLSFMLPELALTGTGFEPLRVLPDVPEASLTVEIDPATAADETKVNLSSRGYVLRDYCLPPIKSGQSVHLRPQKYVLKATSNLGPVDPERRVVDLRLEDRATIRVLSGSETPSRPSPSDRGVTPSRVDIAAPSEPGLGIGPGRPRQDENGLIIAEPMEKLTTVDLDGLEAPYLHFSEPGGIKLSVPPGPYRVRFRLGDDIYSEVEVYVEPGEEALVRPTAAVTPLLEEALPELQHGFGDVVVSESIGPMQSAVLQTMLAIIGIKPFDTRNVLFSRFTGLIPPVDPNTFENRPFSLVVAVDGYGWNTQIPEVHRSLRWQIQDRFTTKPDPDAWKSLVPLPSDISGAGMSRIATAITAAPPRSSFTVFLESPHFARLRVASSARVTRATVMTLILRPDGSFDLSQHLLRLPDLDYSNEIVPYVSYGKMIRQLTLGQKLYAGHQLARSSSVMDQFAHREQYTNQFDALKELLYSKWTDPILSCMAYFAWQETSHSGNDWLLDATARNLFQYFRELPDSRLIFVLQLDDTNQALTELLASGDVPLLAEGTRALAALAAERDPAAAPVLLDIARRIHPGQIWTLLLEQPA